MNHLFNKRDNPKSYYLARQSRNQNMGSKQNYNLIKTSNTPSKDIAPSKTMKDSSPSSRPPC